MCYSGHIKHICRTVFSSDIMACCLFVRMSHNALGNSQRPSEANTTKFGCYPIYWCCLSVVRALSLWFPDVICMYIWTHMTETTQTEFKTSIMRINKNIEHIHIKLFIVSENWLLCHHMSETTHHWIEWKKKPIQIRKKKTKTREKNIYKREKELGYKIISDWIHTFT